MTNFTTEQQAFIKEVSTGDQGIDLTAVAGSGKTTTMIEAASKLAEDKPFTKVAAVAFNKKIADELSVRMDAGVTCKTMNAIGHGAWGRRLQGKSLNLNTKKFWDALANTEGKDYRLEEEIEDLPKLVSLAKMNCFLPSEGPEASYGANPSKEDWETIIDHFDLCIEDESINYAINMANENLVEQIDMGFAGEIDFNDQLYMSVCFGGIFPKFDRVMIDEAQDISGIQRKMLSEMLSKNGLLHAIGDPNQAIYGFRGAAHDSMDLLKDEFDTDTMHLTYSFRCGSKIIEIAKRYVPQIKPGPDAHTGSVNYISKDFSLTSMKPGDVVVCRNTRPLVSLAFKMIRRDIPCYVLGRDIGSNLIGLIRQVKAHDLDSLLENMNDWRRDKIAKYRRLGKDEMIEAVNDRAETLIAIVEDLEPGEDLTALREKIKQMFSDMRADTNKLIILCTIHKAKGLEWDHVYFLDSDLLPSRYARQKWQLQQEDNLFYVAVTRAINELTFINSKGIK